mgnify:CR=1 FL=1
MTDERIVAYCGLVCTDCPAYRATQAGDWDELKKVAAQWSQEFDAPNMTAESILCDGCLGDKGRKCSYCAECLGDKGRKCSHCAECGIRACAVDKGVANCAHCPEYACEQLQGFFGFAPEAKAILDGLRAGLVA